MTRRAAGAVLAVLLLVAGCGLPLTTDVPRSAGEVQAGREEPPLLQVIPAGPQPGATPEDIVRGFLDAQISPEGDYAIARQFLAPATAWDSDAGAVIYQKRRFTDRGAQAFRLRFDTTARISDRGSFSLADEPVDRDYAVAQLPTGEFRLTQVPPGVYLNAQERALSFRPYDVYFHPRERGGSCRRPLVADRVFLSIDKEPAQALVETLLAGPTAALEGTVEPALPFAVPAEQVRVSVADQIVTVDLPQQVRELDVRARQRLAAQLVWTLVPTFVGVRLRAGGRELDVRGGDDLQTPRTWAEFDPAGIASDAPVYYVDRDRRLRSLRPLPQSAVTTGQQPVDEVAAALCGSSLAVLTQSATASDELRIGPADGPFGAPVLSRPALDSLSWGPGDQGLWVLERAPQPTVWLVPAPGSTGVPRKIAYEQPRGAGPLAALRVSRDGARIALVFGGAGQGARRLFVGTVTPAGGTLVVSDPVQVAPRLVDVADVAWSSSTTLTVLAANESADSDGPAPALTLRTVSIDGSTDPAPLQKQTPGGLLEVAAAPDSPTVLSARVEGVVTIFVDTGGIFEPRQPGSAPAYPG